MTLVNNTDKGWSWVVMVGSFGAHLLQGFFLNGTGVLQVALLEEYEDAVWKTSLATSLFVGLYQLLGPLAGMVINRWSCRVALILGSVLMTAGIVIAAFLDNLELTIISIGVICGIVLTFDILFAFWRIGGGLSGTTSEVIIGFNFVKYRNLACGLAVSGVGIGTLIFTPLMQLAKDTYGYAGLCLMCGGLALQQTICGALTRPSYLEEKSKDHENKGGIVRKALSDFLQSFRLLRQFSFACLCSSLTAFSFGVFIMNVHFTSLVLEQGTTKTTAAYYLSIAGACNAASRILVGIAANSDNMNELLLYSGCFSILGTSSLLIPLYINYVPGQIAFAVILGTYSGSCYTLLNSIIVKLVGIENLALAYGMELFAGGVGGVLGPVISGMCLLLLISSLNR
ncbi:hypothetical protein FSP39_005617 [Pinctada imbricata]|uniref:Major facilitator superfamily (MFS) profile domain-containing protein n=1 Tax=Pinctada imbricata TaxID=66713 RepID=A0AA88YGU7_PINIB|nr:hypothetical protein FSP39_005617 [Pinctada imbricata]